MDKPTNMRGHWFAHVAKTRTKMSKKGAKATHQDAMKEASTTWAKAKQKIENRLRREEKSRLKANSKSKPTKTNEE